jgi:hypothetical protein
MAININVIPMLQVVTIEALFLAHDITWSTTVALIFN